MVAKLQRRITAKEREAIYAGLAQGKSGALRWTPLVGQVGRIYSYGFWFF
ncbi:MAG: hypothetical protein J6386_24660 [Candidatus Synoicihabitans palmerolidicus]|nr:hypothetical protein [Candidatus Synoicihabitans palmerolidicus]